MTNLKIILQTTGARLLRNLRNEFCPQLGWLIQMQIILATLIRETSHDTCRVSPKRLPPKFKLAR